MVALDGGTARAVHAEVNGRSLCGRFATFDKVEPDVAALLGVGNYPGASRAFENGRVAYLTAHFGIAGGDIEDDGRLVLEFDDLQNAGIGFERISRTGRVGSSSQATALGLAICVELAPKMS